MAKIGAHVGRGLLVVKLIEKHPNASHFVLRVVAVYVVCLATYAVTAPGGMGGMVLFFMYTAGIAVPVTLATADGVRGLSAQSIAARALVAFVSGAAYVYWMVSMSFMVSPLDLSVGEPLVAAAVSDLFWRSRPARP